MWELFEQPNGCAVAWTYYSTAIEEGREFSIEQLRMTDNRPKFVNLKFRYGPVGACAPLPLLTCLPQRFAYLPWLQARQMCA